MANLHRSLRRYEHARVTVTLDDGSGVRGLLLRVYRDHVLLGGVEALRLRVDAPADVRSIPGDTVVPRRRIVTMQVEA